MPITIKGIRIESVAIKHHLETGQFTIEEARYSLISSTDHVLATQAINGYQGLVLKPSIDTIKTLELLMACYKRDALAALGLDLDPDTGRF